MTIAASRPARAMRQAAVLFALLLAYRFPAIQRRFTTALAVAAGEPSRPSPGVELFRSPARPAANGMAVASSNGPLGGKSTTRSHRRDAYVISLPASMPAMTAVGPLALAMDIPPGVVPTEARADSAPAAPEEAAGALATIGYARLAAGDRRGAVRLFDDAIALGDPRAGEWRKQRDALTTRWSGNAYSIIRADGSPALAARPVLGGGQSGGGLAFTLDPLADQPLALTLRGSAAHGDRGRSGVAAAGIQWRPLAGVTLAAERFIAVGPAARSDWTVRLAAGTDQTKGRWRLTAYGEGGIVGHAAYAAAQGRVGAAVHDNGVEFDPGAGLWASIQHDRGAVTDRIDVGPGLVARAGPLAVELDYRFPVGGNAAPGSGPVLTLSTNF